MKIRMKITEIKKRMVENLKIKMKINNSHPFLSSKSNVQVVLYSRLKLKMKKKQKNQKSQKRRKRKNKRND